MEIVRLVLLLLHVLGFAALLGGLLILAREPVKRVNSLMRDGSGTAVVAGLLLVGVIEGQTDPDASWHWKIAVKLVVGVVILALVMMNLRKERISQALWATLLALTVANIAIAIFWAPAHGSY
jgi:peptidoglycan/LPS O-acetylase OafA/YrhL